MILGTSRGRHGAASRLLAILVLVSPYAASAQGVPPAPPLARLTQDLLLDAEEHDFPAVRIFWVGPRGQIVVPIQQDQQLRIFDSTGTLLARLGRRGEGPGEFQSLSGLGWKADTMVVVDSRLRRFTFVAPEGTLLRSTRYWTPTLGPGMSAAGGASREERLTSFYPYAEQPAGAQVGTGNLAPVPGAARASTGEAVFVRVSHDGRPRVFATIPAFRDPRWSVEVDIFGFALPFALTPQSAVSVTGERFAHLWSAATSPAGGTWTVTAMRDTGDTLFVRTFPFSGVRIPAAVRDSVLAAMLREPNEGAADLPQRRAAISRDRMPPVYPGVEYLLHGLDRSIWVALRPTAEGTPVVMLDGDTGEPVARVLLPRGERLRQATRTRAWVTRMDDDGVASVVRYRITGIPPGR